MNKNKRISINWLLENHICVVIAVVSLLHVWCTKCVNDVTPGKSDLNGHYASYMCVKIFYWGGGRQMISPFGLNAGQSAVIHRLWTHASVLTYATWVCIHPEPHLSHHTESHPETYSGEQTHLSFDYSTALCVAELFNIIRHYSTCSSNCTIGGERSRCFITGYCTSCCGLGIFASIGGW